MRCCTLRRRTVASASPRLAGRTFCTPRRPLPSSVGAPSAAAAAATCCRRIRLQSGAAEAAAAGCSRGRRSPGDPWVSRLGGDAFVDFFLRTDPPSPPAACSPAPPPPRRAAAAAGRRGEDARAQVPVRQYTAVDTTRRSRSLCLLPHRQGGVRELVLESIVHEEEGLFACHLCRGRG